MKRIPLQGIAYILLFLGFHLSASEAKISGELKQWHKITLTVDGPVATEEYNAPNPFLDYRMTVIFTHESGRPRYEVPGYLLADGKAAQSAAVSGNKWRTYLSPGKSGRWTYEATIVVRGKKAVIDDAAAKEHPDTHFNAFAPGLVDSEIQETIWQIGETDKYPTIKKLQDARYTDTMPDATKAAPMLIDGMEKALQYESGSFVDVREIQ